MYDIERHGDRSVEGPAKLDVDIPDDFECDGCTMAPDIIFGVDLRVACRIHDYRYSQAENRGHRQKADREFYWNIIKAGGSHRLAFTYWVAVRMFGWYFYNRKIKREKK